MRLSTFTDYGLRVLMYLTGPRDRLVTISEIAKAYQISENHLMKVVHQLGKAGYIETVRGKGGGMRLGMEPKNILVGEIVRAMESDCNLVECMSENATCRIQDVCKLKAIVSEGLEAMFAALNSYSIADIVDKQAAQALSRLTPTA